MPGKEEWALWAQTAQEVKELESLGQGIAQEASNLLWCRVDPPLSSGKDLEMHLSKIEERARAVMDRVERLRRFTGGV